MFMKNVCKIAAKAIRRDIPRYDEICQPVLAVAAGVTGLPTFIEGADRDGHAEYVEAIVHAYGSVEEGACISRDASRKSFGSGCGHSPILLSANATRKPATLINPAKSCATSKASGILVSTGIATVAPAAMVVVAATTSAERCRKTVKPTSDAIPDAMPDAMAMPPRMPHT